MSADLYDKITELAKRIDEKDEQIAQLRAIVDEHKGTHSTIGTTSQMHLDMIVSQRKRLDLHDTMIGNVRENVGSLCDTGESLASGVADLARVHRSTVDRVKQHDERLASSERAHRTLTATVDDLRAILQLQSRKIKELQDTRHPQDIETRRRLMKDRVSQVIDGNTSSPIIATPDMIASHIIDVLEQDWGLNGEQRTNDRATLSTD